MLLGAAGTTVVTGPGTGAIGAAGPNGPITPISPTGFTGAIGCTALLVDLPEDWTKHGNV